eukprot:jgi/Chrpa1/21045/Chrysochromulina_OHIO_Genome00009058-RA
MLARVLFIVAFFAFSAEAFVAPASPALSVSVAARGQTSIDMMAAPKKPVKKAAPKKAAPKKVVAKKPVKTVVKKAAPKPVAKKVAPKKVAPKKVAPKKSAVKSGFRPGKQMPASQAVNELLGGFINAFNLLRSLPK